MKKFINFLEWLNILFVAVITGFCVAWLIWPNLITI